MKTSSCNREVWGRAFRAETMAVLGEPFWACLAEAIATVECGAGDHVIKGPCEAGGATGLNEIGYKAIAGKPALEVVTHEAHGAVLARESARFRLFRDRAEQAASLRYLLRTSPYYEAARLLFVLTFYCAYAPGRAAGLSELLHVFNNLAEAGHYPGVRPFAMIARAPGDAPLAHNHAAARAAIRMFGEVCKL